MFVSEPAPTDQRETETHRWGKSWQQVELKYQNRVISIFFLNQIDLRKTIFVFFQQNPPSQGRKGAHCSHCMEPITNSHVSHSLYGNFTRYRTKLVVIEMYLYPCPYFGIRFILVTPVSIQHKLITCWGKRASKRTKNVGTIQSGYCRSYWIFVRSVIAVLWATRKIVWKFSNW